ncbi:hypothetical protein [Paenibacillus sp. P13VS]|uniref:hypothetical protein n=1 Tax=Paenibacillus sp. P13VS TaxID=2697367 RepID=UPI00187B7D97|nr:hypothetical protein [Paenibacillus sp. P13VS]MBE7680122.1 hypothetical protein [Paenibacillus sp. P13VS]
MELATQIRKTIPYIAEREDREGNKAINTACLCSKQKSFKKNQSENYEKGIRGLFQSILWR